MFQYAGTEKENHALEKTLTHHSWAATKVLKNNLKVHTDMYM